MGIRKKGFTVLELLAVLAIISILAVLVFAGSPSLLQGAGLTQGVQNVSSILNLAHQTAISQNVPTFAVVRTTGDSAWRRIAIFSAPASGVTATNWTQVSKWQTLPAGAIIDSSYDPASESLSAIKLSDSTVVGPTTPIQDGASSLAYQTDYYAIGFLPDGSVQGGSSVALRMVRGRLVNGVAKIDLDSGGAPKDWVKLIILQVTGNVKEVPKGS